MSGTIEQCGIVYQGYAQSLKLKCRLRGGMEIKMKKFILLSYTISRMGGGQMYQYNKLKYMKKMGYDTYVLYAIPGKIVITDYENVSSQNVHRRY